jgi:hypothetical protein
MMDQTELATRCDAVARLSRQALDWIGDPENAEKVESELKSLTRTLRRSARRSARLARSARTKMSVSVFGPSQAGKSFLVSVLARPKDGRLVADFNGPGGKLDYIREINPEGEGESTGLVTRFTMTREQTPEGFPIRLVLLSEADIARTIINSFYMDGDQSEPAPEPEALSLSLGAARAKAGSAEIPGLSADEMFEIGEYVENNFGRAAYAAALKGFWEEAAPLAPRLSIRDRAQFLSLLWGGYQPLTDLYVELVEGLARIDHAGEVFTSTAALIPRDTSIIDVKTLRGLFTGGDALPIRTPLGKVVDLPRAIVCALAAELVFPMETQPSPLFGETDLLDFPGARNRFEQPLSKTLADPETAVAQLLLRGKVAYLFDRYVENQEITSMLLCVPDSNMETLDLPGLVDNWIALTHGQRPESRADTDCVLFFVLTKFDKHLGESAAGGGEATRFERRLQASLIEKFGRGKDGWVETWTPGRPFQNCYWLRNPNFFVDGLIDYDANQREVAIRPEKRHRVAELRAGCLSAPNVARHFKDPAAAWDAALALNDGGVGYLLGELAAVCTPVSKIRQIGNQIDKIARDVSRALGGFHVSDDIGERIAEKRIAAADIIDGLENTLRSHRFGSFLNTLCVDQDSVQDRIARVPPWVRISDAVSAAATPVPVRGAPPPPIRPSRPGRPDRPAPAAEPAPAPEASKDPDGIRTMTSEHFQTSTAIDVWVERLTKFREDEAGLAVYGLTPALASDLTTEMIHGLRRTGVPARIMAELKEISYGLTVDKKAPPAAIVCGEQINRFVTTLGAPDMPASERPTIATDNGGRIAFAERRTFDSADTLPPEPRASAEETWTDWVYTLEALFVGNAKDTGGGNTINIAQNARLGEILAELRPEEGP